MGATSDTQTPKEAPTDGTSSADGGYFTSHHKIVSIDIPDPDNFLAALQIIRDFPGYKISIILSPRPVSFAAPLFSIPSLAGVSTEPKDKFNKISTLLGAALPGHNGNDAVKEAFFDIIRPLPKDGVPEWAERLDESYHGWFYHDLDAKNSVNEEEQATGKDSRKEIYKDSEIYLALSAHRLADFLDANGISQSSYKVYCDIESLENITVGMRHAFHKHDFMYGFNDEERELYDELVGSNGRDGAPNATLREGLRKICEQYITRMQPKFPQPVEKLSTLIEEYQVDKVVPDIFVAGPFTETLKYIKGNAPKDDISPFKNLQILAMGGFIHGKSNLFPNQFNFHADMTSAKTLLELVEGNKNYTLTLLPTECVKESLFSLGADDLKHWNPLSQSTVDLITLYYKGERNQVYNLFDWVTALTIKHPGLLSKKEVKHRVEGENPGIIHFLTDQREWSDDETKKGGKMFMYQKDEELMKEQRGNLLQAMKETLEKGSKKDS